MGRKKQEITTPMQVRISPETREALKRLAAEDRRSLNGYLKIILENHVRAVRPSEAARV